MAIELKGKETNIVPELPRGKSLELCQDQTGKSLNCRPAVSPCRALESLGS